MDTIDPRLIVVALLCESFFCGVLTILFGVSVYVVLFRRARTRTTYVLLAVNVVLYAMSVIHWIINSLVILEVVSVGMAESLIIAWSPSINHILCDAIVVWRAWLIWECNAIICIPSFVCLFGTLASVVVGIVLEFNGHISLDLALGPLMWAFLFGSNLWTTSIIAWRAWRHRRFIKSQLGAEGSARTNAEKVLGLLIESGAMYCCIWSVYIGIYYGLQTAMYIPHSMLVQLIALYPITIIIIVHIRATSSNSPSKIPSIEFLTPPDVSSGHPDPDRYSITSG